MRLLLIWLFMTSTAFAADQCIDLDIATWTQEQKNHIKLVGGAVAYDAVGQVLRVVRWSNRTGEICFQNPPEDMAPHITEQTMLDRYFVEKAKRDAANVIAEAKLAELLQLQSDLDSLPDAWNGTGGLSTLEKFQVHEKQWRIWKLRRALGR